MPDSIEEQLVKYLTDAHSIEVQALRQMQTAPKIAGDDEIAQVFSEHCTETEEHERRVEERLEAHGADPSKLKDALARAGAVGMVLFARSQPDTPGKLVAHAYSYEHMELAAHDLLAIAADKAGDPETAATAREIRDQEAAMADRLAANFDRAVEASLRDKDADDLEKELVKYLADAHAIENQAIQLLQAGPAIAGVDGLKKAFAEHLEESERHKKSIEARLEAHDASPNAFKDAAMRLGALNIGGFFGGQPGDTPAKLAGFAFAFEHLETAAYELLARVARRAGDEETAGLAERIAGDERAMGAVVRAEFEPAMEASLAKSVG